MAMTVAELDHVLLQIQEQTMRTQEHPQVRLDRICTLIADAGEKIGPPAPKAAEDFARRSKRQT